MRSILIASSQPTGADPAVSFAADLARRTGAATTLAGGASAEAILEQARAAGADLVVLSPRIPPSATAIDLDRAATRVLLRCEPAVLVLRPPVREIRRILVPVRRDDLRRGSLAPALEWAGRLRGEGTDPAEVHLLHVARDPDEMHADLHLLRDGFERRRVPDEVATDVRRFRCVRWGAPPHVRIARWAARHEVDLVILRRHDAGAASGSPDLTWFHALGAAGRPALLLPLGEVAPDAPGAASRAPAADPRPRDAIPDPRSGHADAVAATG